MPWEDPGHPASMTRTASIERPPKAEGRPAAVRHRGSRDAGQRPSVARQAMKDALRARMIILGSRSVALRQPPHTTVRLRRNLTIRRGSEMGCSRDWWASGGSGRKQPRRCSGIAEEVTPPESTGTEDKRYATPARPPHPPGARGIVPAMKSKAAPAQDRGSCGCRPQRHHPASALPGRSRRLRPTSCIRRALAATSYPSAPERRRLRTDDLDVRVPPMRRRWSSSVSGVPP